MPTTAELIQQAIDQANAENEAAPSKYHDAFVGHLTRAKRMAEDFAKVRDQKRDA